MILASGKACLMRSPAAMVPAHGACESGDAARAELRAQFGFQLDDRVAGDVIVEPIVPHLGELIHDAHGVRLLAHQAIAFVVNFLDVAFAAVGFRVAGAVAFDLFEALAAHAFGQNDLALEAGARADPRAADAVIAGAGEDKRVLARLDVAVDVLFGHDRIRRADLVAARGEVLRHHDHDLARHVRQRLRHDEIVRAAVIGLLPVDVEIVDRIERIIDTCGVGTSTNFRVDLVRVKQFFECGK